jgi:signal transduction histidine kinase
MIAAFRKTAFFGEQMYKLFRFLYSRTPTLNFSYNFDLKRDRRRGRITTPDTMSITIALSLSVLLQFLTAIIALSLIKRTRTNIAWWLISLGFLLMAIRRLFELLQVFEAENTVINNLTNSWLGVAISVLMLVSLSFIRRIFNIQERLNSIRRTNEARVFSAIIRTEEEQKYKFARELHDGLGPLLSSVKISISSVLKESSSEKEYRILANAENLITESIKTVKEISNNLSPHLLMNFGLLKALKSFVNNIPDDKKPDIKIHSNIEDSRFGQTTESVVYRVVCELITNSLKHSGAGNIVIDIFETGKIMNINYRDDGKGFNYKAYQADFKGMGLTNILSRIRSVNGTAQISSKESEGFQASFTIKL